MREDYGDKSLSEAQSLVVKSLRAAGIDEQDAERISLNCPLSIQKLRNRSIEVDEIMRWAGVEDEAVVELNNLERWSVVLEFVGVQEQAASRVSRVLLNSSLPEFLNKVGTLCSKYACLQSPDSDNQVTNSEILPNLIGNCVGNCRLNSWRKF